MSKTTFYKPNRAEYIAPVECWNSYRVLIVPRYGFPFDLPNDDRVEINKKKKKQRTKTPRAIYEIYRGLGGFYLKNEKSLISAAYFYKILSLFPTLDITVITYKEQFRGNKIRCKSYGDRRLQAYNQGRTYRFSPMSFFRLICLGRYLWISSTVRSLCVFIFLKKPRPHPYGPEWIIVESIRAERIIYFVLDPPQPIHT